MTVLTGFGPRVQPNRRRRTFCRARLLAGLALLVTIGCSRDPGAIEPGQRERADALLRGAETVPVWAGPGLALLEGGGAKKRAKKKPDLPTLDSHRGALERQLRADWGEQSDRDGQARFPLVDSRNWHRVRFKGVPTFTAFAYGKDPNAITGAFAVPVQGQPSSRKCMAMFEARAIQELDAFGGKRTKIREKNGTWREQELLIHAADGELDVFFKTYRFSVAWAAYPGYSNGCIVYSTVVLWGDEPKLAMKVRDRWVREGFERYVAHTAELPYRH